MLGRRDVLKRIEAEVQDLETRHAGVLRRLEAATTEAEQAIAAQRHLLTADQVDAAAARKAADACRLATDRRAALEDASASLHAELDHTRARLAAERDRRFRESAAAEVEAGADAIEAAAAELSRAAALFDLARGKLVDACQDFAPKDPLGGDCRHAILTAAGRQAGLLPRESQQYWLSLHLDAIPAAAEAVAPMRARATAIREGAVTAATPAQPASALPAPTFLKVRIALWQPAYYQTSAGQRIALYPGDIEAPEPIAAEAFARGIAFPPGSAQGQKVLLLLRDAPDRRIVSDGEGSVRAIRSTGPGSLPPPPDPVFLGELPNGADVLARAAE